MATVGSKQVRFFSQVPDATPVNFPFIFKSVAENSVLRRMRGSLRLVDPALRPDLYEAAGITPEEPETPDPETPGEDDESGGTPPTTP